MEETKKRVHLYMEQIEIKELQRDSYLLNMV